MSKLFLYLLNISITAGWIVLIVVLLRFVLKKAPKWIRVALWGLVAIRLLVPVSIESVLSLVPSAETVSVEPVTYTPPSMQSSLPLPAVEGERIVLHSGFETLNSAVNPTAAQAAEHFDIVAVLKTVAGWIWLFGAVAMLLYALISYLRVKHKVRASVKVEKGVYVCDEIRDPFILGLIIPKIYLPSGMDEATRAYVLAHERAHLKRFDHIWKPLGFLLLAVYWFNPLLWLAYLLLCRDIELACDEKVIGALDDAGKAAYSEALLSCSVSRRSIVACPLAFGEVSIKSRVKSILNYKKPAFWIILVAVLAGIAVAVCFLTVPKKEKPEAEPEETPAPVAFTGVMQWFDTRSESQENPVNKFAFAVDTFPDVVFLWKEGYGDDSILAVDSGRTRTLFTGMPILNVFFADVTGDGKPDLCATVSFGSGWVDEHVVVYDYANKQSYTLWDRFQFDFHLSIADGALLVDKTLCNSYSSDTRVLDTGTLVMQDGLLCCRWQSDGSVTVLNRELHESELYGEWLVREETDVDGNVLYTNDLYLWKEYHFKEDGTVTYNETVPVSSDYDLAFGHPKDYPFEVHDDYVYIAGNDASGAFRWGQYDRDTRTLTLMYSTDAGTVYAKLRRMSEDAQGETTLDEATLCTIWMLAELEAPDGSSGDARALGLEQYLEFRSDGTVREIDVKAPSDRVVPYTLNGNTVQFDGRVLRYDSELKELIEINRSSDVLFYTPAPNAGRTARADVSQTLEEILLGTYICTGAEQNGQNVPVPAEYAGMTIDLGETSGPELYRHVATVAVGGVEKNGYDWTVDSDDILVVWNPETGEMMRFEWFPKQTACTTLKQIIDQANPITVIFTFEDNVLLPVTDEAPSLTQEQADAFVNGLSVEFEDGSPYGCDLVVFIDGFGRCLNVGDKNAFEHASLRFELFDKHAESIIYTKYLDVGDHEYYIGDFAVLAYENRLYWHDQGWGTYERHSSEEASIFVTVSPSLVERNREVAERACVIKAFDAENRTVTVSFVSFDEPQDGYPAEILYDTVEEEEMTLRVTDDTFLSILLWYDNLVKPDRFFRYLEENRYYLNGVDDGTGDDRGIGFWIGLDGDTLLYLCEVYEE